MGEARKEKSVLFPLGSLDSVPWKLLMHLNHNVEKREEIVSPSLLFLLVSANGTVSSGSSGEGEIRDQSKE